MISRADSACRQIAHGATVHVSVPARPTVKESDSRRRARPRSGLALSYGLDGLGSASHLRARCQACARRRPALHVPFAVARPAVNDPHRRLSRPFLTPGSGPCRNIQARPARLAALAPISGRPPRVRADA